MGEILDIVYHSAYNYFYRDNWLIGNATVRLSI